MDLSRYVVESVPPIVYYVPEFISTTEENDLMKQIYDAPKPKWTELMNRRLQNWGGVPHEKGMIPETMPKWLQTYCDKVEDIGIFGQCKPNHILVNEYLPGQGIMPHTDGPLYYPVVANITLNSYGILNFYHSISNQPYTSNRGGEDHSEQLGTSLEERHFSSIFLERRSLIIVQEDMYSNYLHGITEQKEDLITDKIANLSQCPERHITECSERKTRVSLTIRNVPKVLKAKFLFGKKK